MSADAKEKRERRVFYAFSQIAGLCIRPGQIRSRPPPEPDILATSALRGSVAFELVEIIDSGLARTLNSTEEFLQQLRSHYAELPEFDRRSLASRLSRALVWIEFRPGVSDRRRRATIPHLLNELRRIRRSFTGTLPLTSEGLVPVVRAVDVTRGDFSGPCFDCPRVSFISSPLLARLQEKFARTYRTPHPIELVAYYELHPEIVSAPVFNDVRTHVQQHLGASPFSRCWIVNLLEREVRHVYPRV